MKKLKQWILRHEDVVGPIIMIIIVVGVVGTFIGIIAHLDK